MVCNFSGVDRKDYKVGVLYDERYSNTDLSIQPDFIKICEGFGGKGFVNSRVIASKEDECDTREDSIRIKSPAFGINVFSYTPFTAKEKAEIEKQKEIERQRRIAEERKRKAIEAESAAKEAAKLAKEKADEADRLAKEALKRAMEEAQYAQELEKKAKELEKERQKIEVEKA